MAQVLKLIFSRGLIYFVYPFSIILVKLKILLQLAFARGNERTFNARETFWNK